MGPFPSWRETLRQNGPEQPRAPLSGAAKRTLDGEDRLRGFSKERKVLRECFQTGARLKDPLTWGHTFRWWAKICVTRT